MSIHTLAILSIGLGLAVPFLSTGARLARRPQLINGAVDDLLVEGIAHGLAVALLFFVIGTVCIVLA